MAAPSEGQQAALLASLRAHLTAAPQAASSSASTQQYDDDILRSLLAVEDWNVSRAVALFKQVNGDPNGGVGSGETASASDARPSVEDDAATARRLQQMEVDDSQVGLGSGETLRAERTPLWPGVTNQQLHQRRNNRVNPSYGGTGGPFGHEDRLQEPRRNNAVGGGPGNGWPSILTILYQTLTLPFSLAQGLLFFILRLLRIRPPGTGGAGGGSGFGLGTSRFHPSAGTRMTIDARAAAERYIQELEQDLAGGATSSSAGESDSTQSRTSLVYPPLFVGSYSQACQRAKEELKILAIILTSVDNPDSDTFRRHTLTDSALSEVLSGPDFLVWAGDIREREAWQVADICDATSFPFVAFVSLQPSRGGGSTSRSSSSSSLSTPRLAILSRHSGQALVKPTPASAAAQLTDHLSGLLLPRVQPYLARLRSERARLASERALRAEQDAAFERAAQADIARVQARREAERVRVEEERRQREAVARVEEQKRKVLHWRLWARANLVPAEPSTASDDDVLVQFRLPGGRSLQRSFRLDDELEGIFAYIETAAVGLPDENESDEVRTMARSPPSDYQHQYTFDLFLSGYPRKRVSPAEIVGGGNGKTRIREVDGLNDVKRANVIVEGTIAGASGSNTRAVPGAEEDVDSSGDESD
ncbi:UBX domain-containing protein 10 [Tilletia horrida]|nr:UBX domain-containing protein 10 [Tilletia horrida]